MTANESKQKLVFGAPLLKPKIISEPQFDYKPKGWLEKGTLSGIKVLHNVDNNNLNKLEEATVTTKMPTFINMDKTKFPQVKNKPEDFLKNVTVSEIELLQKGDKPNMLQFKEATITTKIPESINMDKTIFSFESDINNIQQTIKSSLSPTSQKENTAKDPCLQFLPKRPVTPFLSWCISERVKVKNELANVSFKEVGKELGKRWAALNPEIKQFYQDKYREEKVKYDRTTNNIHLFGKVQKIKSKDANNVVLKKRKLETSEESKSKKIKKSVDTCAPKKPPSAFVVWSKEQRERINVDMGNLSFIDMGKELGKRWASEALEVKDFYKNIYKEKKEKYDKDLETYKICQSIITSIYDNVHKIIIENSVDHEVSFDTLKKRVLRDQKGGDRGVENKCWGSDMVKPYFKFVMGHWRACVKTTEDIIPDAGPLDVIDFLNQMWGEQGDNVNKHKKSVSNKPKWKSNLSHDEGKVRALDIMEEQEVKDSEP